MDNTMEKKQKQMERMKYYQLLVRFSAKRKKGTNKAK